MKPKSLPFLSLALGAIAFCGAASGCAANYTQYIDAGQPRAALPAGTPVRVYLTQKPEAPYDEVGLIEVRGGSQPWRIEQAKAEAARRGANAILLMSTTTALETTETTREVETKDDSGNVIQTRTVPVTNVSTDEVDRFAALWVPPR